MIKKLAVIILSLALVACVFCACDKAASSNDGEDGTAAVSTTNDDGDKAEKAEKKEKKDKKKEKKKDGEEKTAADLKDGEIMLGSTNYSVTLPERIQADSVSADETANMVVAKFYSLVNDLEFTVAQWTKAEEETVEVVMEDFASMYSAETTSKTTENGVDVVTFEAQVDHNGMPYDMTVCLMQAGDHLVELDFWSNGEDAKAEVESIINSLRK